MTRQSILYISYFFLGLIFILSCNNNITPTSDTEKRDAETVDNQPYLILISLDGFRWDYVDRFKPPHLSDFIENGFKAESLIPSFPSKTFTNHYTIATGMYPDKHGILSNVFYDYDLDETYTIRKQETIRDGRFYKGTPIWVQAAKAGMNTASFFFIGTEAEIQGIRPTYFHNFDGRIPNEKRVAQALDWLALPKAERPHFITMYFSDMDSKGHDYGPHADEKLKQTLYRLDAVLGSLFTGIADSKLPVNVIIVSDHGMMKVPIENFIATESIENDDLYRTVNNGSIVNIHPKDNQQVDSIFSFLKSKENNFKVYKTADVPPFEYSPKNKNWGSLQVLPEIGYYFHEQRIISIRQSISNKTFGQHGYDPAIKEMHGILYGNGPAFKNGYVAPSVKNIHIYPLMCKILGLDIPADIDGDLKQLKSVLK